MGERLYEKGSEKYKDRLVQNLKDYKMMLEESDLLETEKDVQLKALVDYKAAFDVILKIDFKSERAHKEYEKVRELAHVLEKSIQKVLIKDSFQYLMACRNEKDYLQSRDVSHVKALEKNVEVLESSITQSKLLDEHKLELQNLLKNYKSNFLAIVTR